MRAAGIAVILFCLLPLSDFAKADSPKTSELIEQAAAKYADLDFETALGLMGKAYKNPENSRDELVRIYHMMGLCLGALGQYEAAGQSFARLLSLDPTFRLGANVSPRVRQPFDDLTKKNPQRIKARLLPPTHAEPGKPLVFTANVINDPVKMIEGFRVWFRRAKGGPFSTVKSSLDASGEKRLSIPAPVWEGALKEAKGTVQWYAVVEGEHQSRLQNFGDAAHPLFLEVTKKPDPAVAADESKRWYERWWVWALVGTAVAGATATAVVLTTQEGSSGPFDFTVDFSTSP